MKKCIQESEFLNFKILKFKLAWLKKHLYLCGFVIADIKSNSILRTCIVVSYNPAVFEIDISEEIKKIETLIYRYKLEEGNSQDLAKKIVLQLYKTEEKVSEAIQKEKLDVIKEILCKILNIEDDKEYKLHWKVEFLKHEQLIKESLEKSNMDIAINKVSSEKFFIKSKPVRDNKKGITVDKIKPKSELLFELVDTREIAKHIMRILFSKNVKEFYAKVIEIKQVNTKYYEIVSAITPTILTKVIVDKTQKLVVKK